MNATSLHSARAHPALNSLRRLPSFILFPYGATHRCLEQSCLFSALAHDLFPDLDLESIYRASRKSAYRKEGAALHDRLATRIRIVRLDVLSMQTAISTPELLSILDSCLYTHSHKSIHRHLKEF